MEGEKFAIGLKVLVVDDDLAYLKILESLLIECKYKVTTVTEAIKALEMLRKDKNRFDIVISDVHMERMDGFKLLELIGLELDIPVIMLSGNDDTELVMKGVKHGVVDYLVKPVRLQELKNIWQHVVRKNLHKGKVDCDSDAGIYASFPLSIDGDEVSNTKKKARFVWSNELHNKFIAAIEQLGPENVYPKKIMDCMNVEGLTRDNVASHLMKYRRYLERMNSLSNEPIEEIVVASGIQELSTYMNNVPLSNSFGMHYRLGDQINGLSLTSSGNQALATTVQPNVGVPCLEDYTRKMGIQKNSSNPQHNVVHGNQPPSSSFNDISNVHNALEPQFVQVTAAPECYFTQNVGCNMVESTPYNTNSPMIPNIGSSNESFKHNSPLQYNDMFGYAVGQMNDVATSSSVQNAEILDIEVDALMRLDDNYMHESTGLLEDIVKGVLK